MKRWRSIAAVALVFLCGAAAGSLVTGKIAAERARVAAREGFEGWARRGAPRLVRALDLSPEQVEAVRPILRDAAEEMRALRGRVQPEMRAVAERASERIAAELDPGQKRRFEALRKRARDRWWEERQR